MKPFFVYMLRCNDGTYYVGHTDDLENRVLQHVTGALDGYTSTRRPVTLVWSVEATSREDALDREMQVKGWSRAKKEALVRGDWDAIVRLSGPRTGRDTRSRTGLALRQAQGERRAQRDRPVRDRDGNDPDA